MAKVIIIDEKMNTVEVELTPQKLQMLGIKQEDVKKHPSRRQLYITIAMFIKSLQL